MPYLPAVEVVRRAQTMLAGYNGSLRVRASMTPDGGWPVHAWLDRDGEVVKDFGEFGQEPLKDPSLHAAAEVLSSNVIALYEEWRDAQG